MPTVASEAPSRDVKGKRKAAMLDSDGGGQG